MRVDQLLHAKVRDCSGKSADLSIRSTVLIDGRRLKVVDEGTWTEKYIDIHELRRDLASGAKEIRIPGGVSASKLLRPNEEVDEKNQVAMQLIAKLEEMMRNEGLTFNKAYLKLSVAWEETTEIEGLAKIPTRSWVYKLFARHKRGQPLLSADSVKGNRVPRYSEPVRELIEDLAREHYLFRNSPWTISDVAENATAQAHGAGLLASNKTIGREFISRFIHTEIDVDEELARLPAEDIKAAKSIAKQRIRVGGPFERIEQDAVHLPIKVRTPWGVSGNMWLVYNIDCYLSMHLGWALVHGAPTAKDALLCLERTLFSKKDDLNRLGVETDLDLYGLPMSIYFDNGPEAKNERMRNLTRLRITTFYCASRNPAGKPHIERSNRSLKKDMRTLRGTTQLNGVDGQRDPEEEGDDLMDIAELEKWIVEWLFIKWPNKPLERHKNQALIGKFRGHTSAQVLRSLEAENYVMPLPPNRKDWNLVKYERHSLTLRRKTGIEYKDFEFAGPNLPKLIEIYGENKVEVLVDPDDFRFVLVAVGDAVDLVRLINKDINESTPAYSYAQAKEKLSDLPEDESGREKAKAFDRNTFENSVGATKNRKPPKGKREQAKEAQTRAKHDAAVDRAVRNPVTPPSQEQRQTSANVGAVHVSMKDVGVFEVKKSSPKAGGH